MQCGAQGCELSVSEDGVEGTGGVTHRRPLWSPVAFPVVPHPEHPLADVGRFGFPSAAPEVSVSGVYRSLCTHQLATGQLIFMVLDRDTNFSNSGPISGP